MSKIGLQSQNGTIPDFGKVIAKQPIAWLLLGNAVNLGIAQAIRAASPSTLILLRTGGDWAYKDDAWNQAYLDHALQVAAQFQAAGLCDFLLPPNEPVISNDVEARQLNDRQVWYAGNLKARGFRTGAYCFSVGNPQYALWQYLQDGIRACDGWLFLHQYDVGAAHPEIYADTSLRHRNVKPLIAPDIDLKIGITECLIDLNTRGDLYGHGGGYRALPDNGHLIEDYTAHLSWWDSELAKDAYVKFATVFGYSMLEPWVGLGFDVANDDGDRQTFINWLQPGTATIPPPVDPPPTGGSMTTAEKRSADGFVAAQVAYNKDAAIFKYAQAQGLGYPVTNEYEATYDAAVWVNQGYADAIVGCVKGDWGNVKAFDWLTGAPYVPPTTPPVQPPTNPQICPAVIAANGAVCELISPPRKYVLAGASVKQGVSAFCVVTVIGRHGVPAVGVRVVNIFKDSTNGEVVQTDGSGAARFQFGASSASSVAGQGPFTFAVSLDGWKDTDAQPPVLHAGTIISDLVHSVSDWEGQHTEWAIQFVEV